MSSTSQPSNVFVCFVSACYADLFAYAQGFYDDDAEHASELLLHFLYTSVHFGVCVIHASRALWLS